MATIINNPDSNSGNSGGAGLVVGVVLAIIIVFLFIAYALPALRRGNSGVTVNVPDKVNVNVNKTAQ
jgi:high-affinity Fe2+/Pb2+ permease